MSEKNNRIPNLISFDKLVFRIGELSRMTEVSSRQLRYWEQRGYISAMTRNDQNKARVYDFHTFIEVRIIKRLLDEGYRLPAAVERMRNIDSEMVLARHFFQEAFQGVEIIDGKAMLNLGNFDDEQTQTLYGLYEDGKVRYQVRNNDEPTV
ncbi:MerR family transcriptional regulator [Secundilactobacillus folii]|uniref:MerR family transcriptional regulator n=1 Tax=Secundilactobacillus folii TaxID=2678357 RepID=A0A7X2XUT7_9LACO|nr:MerR family transcriptional regulator [Secundilactobacillus folii]MTV82088.1 MerR family transcriptional regulator [Secundilactobacillus folii]